MTSNTQNDTSELDALDRALDPHTLPTQFTDDHGDTITDFDRVLINLPEAKQALITLIAQREQAAELRGRIDEDWHWMKESELIGVGYAVVRESKVQERLATLQATKPEKEG